MSYIDQAQNPRRRLTAITGVVAVHAALGVAVVVGLTVTWTPPVTPPYDPPTFPTPKPTPSPPPTPDDRSPRPKDQPVPAPLPPMPWPKDPPAGPIDEGPHSDDAPRVDDTPRPPLPPPRPSPTFAPKSPVPANPQASWITNDDYPAQPLRAEIEGVAEYRLVVGSNGRVSSCEIARSSGNRALDDATCRLISRRARFAAATDGSGASVVGSYSGKVRWDIPD